MSERRVLRLGSLIDIKHGYAFKGEYFSDNNPGPILLTPGNFSIGGGFKEARPKYYLGPVPNEFRLSPGDLVVTMTDLSKAGDTLGYPAIIPHGDYLHNQRIGLISIKAPDVIDKRYLYYVLRTGGYRQHVLAGATGSTVRHTSPARILDYKCAVPGLATQQTISALLGALDDKIGVNDRIIATARRLAESKFEAVARAGQWCERELNSVCAVLSRGVTPRYTDDPDELIVLNQKCVRDGHVTLQHSNRTSTRSVPDHKILRVNDILVNSTGRGTLGRVGLWQVGTPATVDSHMTIVRIDSEKADPVCVGFGMLAAQREIEALGEGSTGQTELRRTRLGQLRLPIPAEEDARLVRPTLDGLEARSLSAQAESLAVGKLRNVLLPKLMSGEIRVRDAERMVEDAT